MYLNLNDFMLIENRITSFDQVICNFVISPSETSAYFIIRLQ